MNASELIARLDSLGIAIAADGERLRVNAARGQLTDDLKQAIADNKSQLLQHLSERASTGPGELCAVARGGDLPTSYFQERLWVLSRMDALDTAYNIVTVWRFPAPTDPLRLAHAIRQVVSAHEVLRATFQAGSDAPVVRLLRPEAVPIDLHDLREYGVAERSEIFDDALKAATRRPFDLEREAPARFELYHAGTEGTAVVVSVHHIAADAWSMALLAEEVKRAYAAGMPAPKFQYADYAAWQRSHQDPGRIADELDWWQAKLAGAPPMSVFPPDRRPSERERQAGATHDFRWDEPLSRAIAGMARANGVTPYMALVAAWATVLYRHSGQDDVLLGSPMGLRERAEFESVIGPFINLLVLRLDLGDDPPFAELLRRSREAVLDAHAHRSVPFEKLLERIRPPRSLMHSPLFQMAVVQHSGPSAASSTLLSGGAIHEMTCYLREADGCLQGSIEYRADLFSPALVQRIAAHVEAVLAAATRDPAQRLSELPLIGAQESEALQRRFNPPTIDFDESVVTRSFEAQVARQPDATAVRVEGGELTYAELNQRANRLARHLRSLGVARDALVGLCVERTLDLPVALLAILKAGGAYVPLDPGFPAERLEFMLEDSGASVLVCSGGSAQAIHSSAGVQRVDLECLARELEHLDAGDLAEAASADDPAYVIYTSGSTGRPKGVTIPHRALANFLHAMRAAPGLSSCDVVAAVTTISFDIAGLELYLPWMVGARVELVGRDTAADGVALAGLLKDSYATVLQATPATWRLLLEADWRPPAGFRALCGGEALSRDLADRLLERVDELWNLYGPTETTIWSTVDRVERAAADVTVGRPIANTQVHVLDTKGQQVPVGIPGEICIGGAGVALGYHRRPELTAEKFLADTFSAVPGARLYRTGDLGRWREDGRLEHLGRLDHQVKIRGFRIELGEIESVLQAHEAVKQCVVAAREAAPGDLRLVVYVVYEPGEDLTVSEVRRHLRGELPDYMIPSMVVTLDAVPLTANGKVDRKALPDPFKGAARAPARHVEPAEGTEQTLAGIWREILRVERVGADDNFFELGGHSLLSLRVAAAIQARFGTRIDPRSLFFQNLRQVAAGLSAAQVEAHSGA